MSEGLNREYYAVKRTNEDGTVEWAAGPDGMTVWKKAAMCETFAGFLRKAHAESVKFDVVSVMIQWKGEPNA